MQTDHYDLRRISAAIALAYLEQSPHVNYNIQLLYIRDRFKLVTKWDSDIRLILTQRLQKAEKMNEESRNALDAVPHKIARAIILTCEHANTDTQDLGEQNDRMLQALKNAEYN